MVPGELYSPPAPAHTGWVILASAAKLCKCSGVDKSCGVLCDGEGRAVEVDLRFIGLAEEDAMLTRKWAEHS